MDSIAIIQSGEVYELILPKAIVNDFNLKTKEAKPLRIFHADKVRLEILYNNISVLHARWVKTFDENRIRRLRQLQKAFFGILFAVLSGIFRERLARFFLIPSGVILVFVSLLFGMSCFILYRYYIGLKGSLSSNLPIALSVIELKERIQKEYAK
jgi:hypothetical protein